jgi:uncharacterized protein YkwD
MRRFLLSTLLSSSLLLAACTALPGVLPTDPQLVEVLRLVNEARAAGADCGGDVRPSTGPLAHESLLGRAAQKHSEDMSAAGVMSHTTPDGAVHYTPGTTFDARIRAEGYSYRSAGENIAWGYPSPEAVVSAWLASPGHCRNIMNSGYSEIGLGREGTFWTQVFGSPQPE